MLVKQVIVSIDLETTGLQATKDAIIEIGAVKFGGGIKEVTKGTLINPGRHITSKTTQITGIKDSMVADQPTLDTVLPEYLEFIGDAPIVGHNVKFDLDFLRQRDTRALVSNPVLDTLELASVLLPSAGRYSLGSLLHELGINSPATHRALKDAMATKDLFLALYKLACDLPLDTLREIVNLGKDMEWGGHWAFNEALKLGLKGKTTVSTNTESFETSKPLFANTNSKWSKDSLAEKHSLEPSSSTTSLDLKYLKGFFSAGGLLQRHFDKYEHRLEQVKMMQAVAESLSQQSHLMVEAGTGTGKSLAYLIPAIQWAWDNTTRVVVSTNTINLQDQLVSKDLPTLKHVFEIPFRCALLKGRSNYVCPRRFMNMRRRGPSDTVEVRMIAKLLVWLPKSESGDRTEITLSGAKEKAVWQRISAEDESCTKERCAEEEGVCPFYQAREESESAHVIVVNHALLVADMGSENKVLPEYDYLIVDEAHHLEDATTAGLTFTTGQAEFEHRLKDLSGRHNSLLRQVMAWCDESSIPKKKYETLKDNILLAEDRISDCHLHSEDFFHQIELFLSVQPNNAGNSIYDQRVLIVDERRGPPWAEVEVSWQNLKHTLSPLTDLLVQIIRDLTDLQPHDKTKHGDLDKLRTSLSTTVHSQEKFTTRITELVLQPSEDQIYWIEYSRNRKMLSLHIAPLNVGQLVNQYLWDAKASVVMTSATLTTSGNTTAEQFQYLTRRLDAPSDCDLRVFGSSYDYNKSTKVFIPTDIPEPSNRSGHQAALEKCLVKLCSATKGRTLALFTSYAQMGKTAHAIRPLLEHKSIDVYDQSSSSSRHQLLESFRTSEGAVLLGTRSFWEGVDVPGDALSVLLIVRLPFDVPSDPIARARSTSMQKEGKDPFLDYFVQEAILRFRQGFGRLIRTRSDRGVVVICDSRISSRGYGKQFKASLPLNTSNIKEVPLDTITRECLDWLEPK